MYFPRAWQHSGELCASGPDTGERSERRPPQPQLKSMAARPRPKAGPLAGRSARAAVDFSWPRKGLGRLRTSPFRGSSARTAPCRPQRHTLTAVLPSGGKYLPGAAPYGVGCALQLGGGYRKCWLARDSKVQDDLQGKNFLFFFYFVLPLLPLASISTKLVRVKMIVHNQSILPVDDVSGDRE